MPRHPTQQLPNPPRYRHLRFLAPQKSPMRVHQATKDVATQIDDYAGVGPTRLTSGFVQEPSCPLVGGNNSPSSASHSRPIFTSAWHFDSELAIWASPAWSYDRRRLGNALHRQTKVFQGEAQGPVRPAVDGRSTRRLSSASWQQSSSLMPPLAFNPPPEYVCCVADVGEEPSNHERPDLVARSLSRRVSP